MSDLSRETLDDWRCLAPEVTWAKHEAAMDALRAAEERHKAAVARSTLAHGECHHQKARAEKAEAALGEAADTYRFRADSLKLARENEDRIREARALDREAMHNAEVLMDTLALLDVGEWLGGQGQTYRDEWARIHTLLRARLRPEAEPTDSWPPTLDDMRARETTTLQEAMKPKPAGCEDADIDFVNILGVEIEDCCTHAMRGEQHNMDDDRMRAAFEASVTRIVLACAKGSEDG